MGQLSAFLVFNSKPQWNFKGRFGTMRIVQRSISPVWSKGTAGFAQLH
jgi:hypothetical protein